MGPDLRVEWNDVCTNPVDYEKLVKLLLQRLHPDGEVIDGQGSDGGREFQLRAPDRLVVYEAKSFTGRVSRRNPNRRRQVEESLKSAARLQPDAWHLVVPIDHNPAELDWFDDLRSRDYPFIKRWYGQTWLEEQIARHPDLLRFATQDKLLEYVRQYKLETEALAGGATTLLERHHALDRLAEEVNPYWRPIVRRAPEGRLYASVEAKRADAAEQAPITFTLGVAIPAAPEYDALRESWRTGLELGTGAKMPREFITEFTAIGPPGLGLPVGDIPDLVEVVAVPDTDVSQLPTQTLAVYEPQRNHPLASLTFHRARRTIGIAGAQVTAFDTAHTVKLVTQVRPQAIQLNLQAQDPRPITPAALLPSVRFWRALTPPNRLTMTIRNGDQRYVEAVIIDQPFLAEPPEETLVELIEDLAAIQNALNCTFPVPDTYTRRDTRNARQLRCLLEGERVAWMRGPLTVTLDPSRVEQFRAQFAEMPQGWLRISYEDIEVDFGEHTVHTGPVFLLGEMSVDVDAIVLPADDADSPPTAVFEVRGDGWMYAQRGTPEDQQPQAQLRPAKSGRVDVSRPSQTEDRRPA